MRIINGSIFAALLAAIILSTVVRAGVTVETVPYVNTDVGKPSRPLFACSAESRRCMYDDDFTSLPLKGNMQLSTCHHDSWPKQLGRWIFNRHHKFINSFWVYCNHKDVECDTYAAYHRDRLDVIAADMDREVTEQTHCKPTFRCYELKDADEKCFSKN
ncbi:peptidyl-arginine deiminase domain protein [Pseudozyma hubeiensis SY62]|uniref:Peptidyl-arginine deiminase domain protein n=1 Tax=Pseudozyma hubeiensis (strain SY62) TaxID=1305764 RepID=R9PN60_PSEHS|nr:peptidyl-arginine deiminase domain protein [Pseudozyma hubeiensis SY62]GAC99570.1 peptidyl-arginine deiminase domain protein [Pseudozyma hubeiensis SY62]